MTVHALKMHYCKFFFKNCQPTASDRSVQVSPSQHALCDSVAVGLCCVYEYVYYDLLPLLVLWELNLWLNYCRAKWCYGSCWSWRAEPRWFYFWCHWRCKWCVPYTVIYYQYCSHSVCTFLCLCLSLKWLNDSISILPATTYLSCKGSRCTRRTVTMPSLWLCWWHGTYSAMIFAILIGALTASDALSTRFCSNNLPCIQRIRGTVWLCALQIHIYITFTLYTGRWRHDVLNLSVHSSSICLSDTKLVNCLFWKWMNQFNASWHKWSMRQSHEMIIFGGQINFGGLA